MALFSDGENIEISSEDCFFNPGTYVEPKWFKDLIEMNENQSEMDKRLSSFGCDRFEYKVNLLPLPRDKETILEIRDYDLYPFNYTTEPLPMDDSPYYNRALIQAIQIQSSWAVPKSEPKPKAVFQEKFVAEEPPIRNPIHIGCPSVSGILVNRPLFECQNCPTCYRAKSDPSY